MLVNARYYATEFNHTRQKSTTVMIWQRAGNSAVS